MKIQRLVVLTWAVQIRTAIFCGFAYQKAGFILTFFKSSKSLKDILIGVAGASMAQVISFLLVPVVARFFSPEHFGAAATFLGVLAITSSLSTLRYEQAVLLPKTEEEALDITWLSLCILCLSVLISIALIIIMNRFFIDTIPIIGEWYWFVLMPLFMLVSGLVRVLLSWGTRLKKFGIMATAEATSTLMVSGFRIGIGLLFGSSILGLLIGNFTGQLSKLFIMCGSGIYKTIINNRPCVKLEKLNKISKMYHDFPLYMAPAAFIREFKENMPLLGISLLFSAQAVGFYAMASRLVRLPVSIVSMPVRRVYIQKASILVFKNRLDICKLLLKYTLFLFGLGSVPFLLLSFNAENLFTFILGDKWSIAGIYTEVMSFWFFSIFILTPSAATFVVMRKQKFWMFFQILGVIFGSAVFLITHIYSLSDLESLAYFSRTQILLNAMIFITAVYITSNYYNPDKKSVVDV